jgi:hypothetical protein
MGLGDDIMLTAKFRNLKKKSPDKNFAPVNKGSLKWSPVFENNPNFSSVIDDNTVKFEVRPRPYLGKINQYDEGGKYHEIIPCYPQKGDIYLTEEELNLSKKIFTLPEKYVTIDPSTKVTSYSSNRDWGHHKWQKVVNAFPDINFIQTSGTPLNNVYLTLNTNVRLFFAVLAQSIFHIGNEGGTVHAATALNKKCVVIFGGLSAPSSTGYDTNINHWVEDPETPCGRTYECEHCKRCLESITVENVIESVNFLKKELY